MATNPPNPPPIPTVPEESALIIEKDLKQEMSKSYIDYAMSVIIGRAIPDVRDGLKPVQRRILYSMGINNFYYNRPHHKCATIVGHVLGHFHPHGDSSVYMALVRMAQDFSLRYMLIDGQGNFGSIDGDAPAAYRYTEARLAKISNEMLVDIEKDTVDFTDNFDGSEKEPSYLPAKVPNLLLNGSTGIAVGMSTNIAPHNLVEIVNAIRAAIDMGLDKFTPQEVAKHILGPDFPTGGIIMGKQGILNAIATGRGAITVRAKVEIVANGAGNKKDAIIVSEIPYMVNKTNLIETIANLVNKGQIPEIADLRDESDYSGLRIFIELKQNSDANACLNRLYQRTQLQSSFNIINLTLINGGIQPKVVNYAEIITTFIRHREEIIKRRTIYDLAKSQARFHIIEGLLIAITNIDEVVAIIKQSDTPATASEKLQLKFQLSDKQTVEILKMPLSRLTNLQTQKLDDEKQELTIKIQEYQDIIASQQKRFEIIKEESLEVAKEYGDDRRTQIEDLYEPLSIDYSDTIPEEDCVIMITQNQAIKRMTLENYQSQRRGGKGKCGIKIREEDWVQEMFIASSHDTILLFTSQGRVYSIPTYSIPMGSRTSRAKAIVNFVNLKPNEEIVDITNIDNFDVGRSLVMVSSQGIIKKTELKKFANIRKTGIHCMSVKDEDKLVRAKLCQAGDEVLIATKNGYAVRFAESELRPIGRSAMGVKGITLREETDEVVDLVVSNPETKIITITKNGYGKHSDFALYRLTHRGGKGVINVKFKDDTDEVIAIKSVPCERNLLLASAKGTIIRIRTQAIRETGRATMGVRVMRLEDGDEITSVALADVEEDEDDDVICEDHIPSESDQSEDLDIDEEIEEDDDQTEELDSDLDEAEDSEPDLEDEDDID